MCDEIMNKQLFPTIVLLPPPDVPGLIVTYYLIMLLSPISRILDSPLYFKSCGIVAMLAKGNIFVRFPICILHSICTLEISYTCSESSTLGPT
jgi:hypothetical protein